MRAGGHAPSLVQHQKPRELAGMGPPHQHAMQADDDKLGHGRLDFIGGQRG